eukprot:2704630-Rhodomonas_salina.1
MVARKSSLRLLASVCSSLFLDREAEETGEGWVREWEEKLSPECRSSGFFGGITEKSRALQ